MYTSMRSRRRTRTATPPPAPPARETIYFDESVLEDGEVICPNCGEKLEFDLNGLEDEDKPQDEE